ncbi:MAG: homoserine kinase [Rickettsiales bacterium]
MAVYTHLTDDDIQRIADSYALGKIVHKKAIAEGVENSNYLIATGETKYILTIYEKRVRLEDIPFFLGIMEHLAEHGIPCPLPLHTTSGESTYALGEKKAAIVTFLEGKSPAAIRNEHMRPLGAMMAKMHLTSEGFSGTRVNDLSVSGWHTLTEKIGNRADDIQPGLAAMIADELAYLEAHWPKDTDLPRGVIHADLFPDNVFYRDGTLSGFIDFYFACTDFYIYDLIITMNAWCFEHGQFNVTKAGLLLSAYNQVKPLTKAEMDAMPLLARGASLRFLLTRAHDMVFHDPNAIVTPKNPMEYVKKLQFHQRVKSVGEYGL